MVTNLSPYKESLELRLETIKGMSNIRYELLNTIYDRRPIAERYLDGSVVIHIHLLTGKDALCISAVQTEDYWVLDRSQVLMFVWVGESSDQPRPVASTIRLQALNCCDVLAAHAPKTPFVFPEVLFRVYNDKLSFLYTTLGVKASQLINEIVKGTPQIFHNLADKSGRSGRSGEIHGNPGRADRHLSSLTVDGDDPLLILQGNTLAHNFGKGADLRPEQIQVFPCPSNLLISAIQRVHALYSNGGLPTGWIVREA